MGSVINFFDLQKMSSQDRDDLMVRTEDGIQDFIDAVKPIIEKVAQEGDKALAHYANIFDNSPITESDIQVSEKEFDDAFKSVDSEVIASIEYGIENIKKFHRSQLPEDIRMTEVRQGVFTGEKFVPIPSVACYVPRGKGSFPSMVMMNLVPAVIAGVPQIIVLTPPGEKGEVDAASLVAARLVGVNHVYKCGGAQAVAAAAFGTETIPKCVKIVGPGSPWVVAAKRLLSGKIHPGIPAGPSESIVFADETANPELAALDILIEAEHGADSSAFLVTTSREVAKNSLVAIPKYLKQLSPERREFAMAVLSGKNGGIVLAETNEDAYSFINDYAPEHLQILSDEPWAHLSHITNASEVLLGDYTPSALANFVLGPNAILPTSKNAIVSSPLNVLDFMKSFGIGYVTRAAYPSIAKHAYTLATYEGFPGHAQAVSETRTQLLWNNS